MTKRTAPAEGKRSKHWPYRSPQAKAAAVKRRRPQPRAGYTPEFARLMAHIQIVEALVKIGAVEDESGRWRLP